LRTKITGGQLNIVNNLPNSQYKSFWLFLQAQKSISSIQLL